MSTAQGDNDSNKLEHDSSDEYRDQEFDQEEFVRVVSQNGEQILERFNTLARSISNLNAKQFPDAIDPDDFDLQTILSAFVNDITQRGLKLRTSGVLIDDISTLANDNSVAFAPTLADLVPKPQNLFKKTPTRKILNNVNGFVNFGEMCLVLGRPGAGCSTLLKTISGETHHYKGVEGKVFYGGIAQKEMVKSFKSDLIYIPEYDEHFPHLTVEQTLKFAVACRTPNTRPNASSREQYIKIMVDLLATVFGLRHTYKTKVGNDIFRGVSGGERKRVSIAEALGARASVYAWDNATRGLDSSTALEYAEAIRTTTNLMKSSSFVTIYQASENIYNLFDKVLVLYEGKQIFFGAVDKARKFFIDMGYEPLNRQSTSEFLTSVTDPLGRFTRSGFEHKVPLTPTEFEQYWINSKEYQQMKNEIAQHKSQINAEDTKSLFKESLAFEKAKRQKVSSQYTITYFDQLKLLIRRSAQRILGESLFVTIQIVFSVIIAFILGSMFWGTPDDTSGAFSKSGIIFFALVFFVFVTSQEIVLSFQKRPIIQRHRSYSFYAPSAEAIADLITDIPVKMVTLLAFVIVTYFLGSLKREAGAFFSFYLFLTLTIISSKALYSAIAAASPTLALGNTFGGVFLIAIAVYSTFMIQLPQMHPWFKWIAHINPIRYGFESMIMPDFHGRDMECTQEYLVPNGPSYAQYQNTEHQVCAFTGSDPGKSTVSGDRYMKVSFQYSYTHVWRNFGILIGFIIFFIAVLIFFSETMKFGESNGDRLLFEKGSIPDEFINSQEKDDIEAGPRPDALTLTKSQKDKELFEGEDLATTDIFSWKKLNYTIPLKDGTQRKLLDDVQGYVKPGQLVALMGESGAGKTTLLNVLSKRVDIGVVTGDMLVNGLPVDNTFKKRTGYVQQQDLHLDELTVRESLIFAARMRRPGNVPDAEKVSYVEKIIKVLNMELYADAIVGEVGNGLNVEQRKKLSIGVELVAKPSLLLFLDEPSSGLDSQSSWAVVQVLKHLAHAGQAILCTIHQPSATLFEQFDKLLLLKKGGETVYFGDIGSNSRVLLDYFEAQGSRKCGDLENPAEFILEAIGAGATAEVTDDWFQKWQSSPQYATVSREIDEIVESKRSESISSSEDLTVNDKSLHNTYNTSWFTQLYYVLHRTNVQFWRGPTYIFAKFGLNIFAGLFIGFTFWNLDDSLIGVTHALFAGFLAVIMSNPIGLQIQERAVKARILYETRESKSNTFHWSVLILSQIITEIPYNYIGTTLYFLCSYFTMRLNQGSSLTGKFYLMLVIIYQIYNVTFSVGIYYFSPDLPTAGLIGSIGTTFMFAFAGILQPPNLIIGFWTFVYKVSPVTYVLQNLVSTLTHGRPVACSNDELSYFTPPDGQTCGEYAAEYIDSYGGYLTDSSSTTECGYCAYTSADTYIFVNRNIEISTYWRNFGFMWVYIIFNVVAILILYYLFHDAKFPSFGKKTVTKATEKADAEKPADA